MSLSPQFFKSCGVSNFSFKEVSSSFKNRVCKCSILMIQLIKFCKKTREKQLLQICFHFCFVGFNLTESGWCWNSVKYDFLVIKREKKGDSYRSRTFFNRKDLQNILKFPICSNTSIFFQNVSHFKSNLETSCGKIAS